MKIIGFIGEPASGKSTVMREIISSFKGVGYVRKIGLIVYTFYHDDKAIVAGIYDDQVFSGTDRLSKSCGPVYREWIKEMVDDPDFDDYTFYWEGERFSNNKFFDFFFQECPDPLIYYLEVNEEVLNERNQARSQQNDTWRKGMKTRMNNLKNKYPVISVDPIAEKSFWC